MVGLNSENIDTIAGKYICRLCFLLLRDPVQLFCGHRYCESCIGDQNRISIQCLQCTEETSRTKMFYDRGMKNDMEVLDISCCFCQWNGLFKNYQDHLSKYHLNKSTGQSIGNPAVFQIRRLLKKLKEYANNEKLLTANMQQSLPEISIYKISIEEQNPPGEILQQNKDLFISYHGTLLLKIDHIQSRLNDMTSVITSPPFYTSPNGYKMCVRLYLNGNGIAQSTHISIFLILMRDDYDAILEWPFNFQVIFGLYDLINQKDHIIESFQSDTTSIRFRRPQGEMNTGTGILKFISKSVIQQDNNPYVCDNSIYIKVMIRKDPIPTSILPDVMSINPGLPVHMQEEIIQTETIRNEMQAFKLILTLKPQKSI